MTFSALNESVYPHLLREEPMSARRGLHERKKERIKINACFCSISIFNTSMKKTYVVYNIYFCSTSSSLTSILFLRCQFTNVATFLSSGWCVKSPWQNRSICVHPKMPSISQNLNSGVKPTSRIYHIRREIWSLIQRARTHSIGK